MTRLFRNGRPGWADYAALAAFVLAYGAALVLLFAPELGRIELFEAAAVHQDAGGGDA